MPNAQCPMPNAQCPMPNAQCLMPNMSNEPPAPLQGEITIRVRYAETDRMGLLHHANHLVYFEQGRTELLRSMGLSYRDLEDKGYLLVLTRLQVRYRSPARYDDLLTLR